jgi:hypothetical protein
MALMKIIDVDEVRGSIHVKCTDDKKSKLARFGIAELLTKGFKKEDIFEGAMFDMKPVITQGGTNLDIVVTPLNKKISKPDKKGTEKK